MNPIEALEYLERVVEADSDADPGIHEAIAVLSATVRCAVKLGEAYVVLNLLEQASTDFVLSILPFLISLPKETFEKLIPALTAARTLLGKEGKDEISSDQVK